MESLSVSRPSHLDEVEGGEETNKSGLTPELDAPHIVHSNKTSAIYRHRKQGIKVIIDSDEGQISRLAHEHNISKYLSSSTCLYRKVLHVTEFQGKPAMYYQWTDGDTLQEWLDTITQQNIDFWNDRRVLQIAIAIAYSLSQLHDAGIAHNKLTPENIVLGTFEGCYVATLIDLSWATICPGKQSDPGEVATASIAKDLTDLGRVLNSIFTGNDVLIRAAETNRSEHGIVTEVKESEEYDVTEDEDSEEHNRQRLVQGNRSKQGKHLQPGEGLPLYLSSLISTLILTDTGRSNSELYPNVKNVLSDLRVLAKKSQLYMKRLNYRDNNSRSRLRIPNDVFYGRQAELSLLLHALNFVAKLGGEPTMTVVSGCAGAGKTTLINQMKKPVDEANGFMIRSKFDATTRPYYVIFSALDAFFLDILNKGSSGPMDEMKSRINNAFEFGCSVLTNSIPNLRRFLYNNEITENRETREPAILDQRWKFNVCKLIGAITHPSHPIVFVFDDLQWADPTSLDVIQLIVTDPDIHHCIYIGCYRDNMKDRVTSLLDGIQAGGVSILTLKLGPIEKESVNALVSEALYLPPSLCMPLSAVVHNKTGGIIMFIVNLLQSINEEGILRFNLSSGRWEYDIAQIKLQPVSTDVVKHVSQRMALLPSNIQDGLKLAACLGSELHADTLLKAKKANGFDLIEFILVAIDGGFLQEISPRQYRWAHDQIQQAAYELIPVTKRPAFHLLIGSRLFLKTPTAELDDSIFDIVGNMNIGLHLIRSQDQRHQVANLNLRAGEKAIALSSFRSAAKYSMFGIKLLDDDCWNQNYELTLRLYNAATTAFFVIADFTTLKSTIENILIHARQFDDKLNAHHTLVRYCNAVTKFKEGIIKIYSILKELGEILPDQIDYAIVIEENIRAKTQIKKYSETNLLALPLMTDKHKLAAMQFMNHGISSGCFANQILVPILIFRMMRMSIEFGLCKLSALALSLYGGWLVNSLNSDFDEAHRMGRVAIKLLEKLGANEFIARIYLSVYGTINIWKEPIQASQDKLIDAYNAGALTGDMESAIMGLHLYSMSALWGCGENLSTVQKNARINIKRGVQYKQKQLVIGMTTTLQHTLELIGSNEDCYMVFLNCTEDECFQGAHENNAVDVCRYICNKRKYMALVRGDMDAAAKWLETSLKYPVGFSFRFISANVSVFLDGLIAMYFARKHDENEERWTQMAEVALESMKLWSESSSWNYSNKLFLLEAEYYFLKDNDKMALEKYEASIEAARDHRFVHEEGLAYEKAASYHLNKGRNKEALDYFAHAEKCYERWGAHTLVNHIRNATMVLGSKCRTVHQNEAKNT